MSTKPVKNAKWPTDTARLNRIERLVQLIALAVPWDDLSNEQCRELEKLARFPERP
jgi:hypothetical protein